MNDKDTIRKKIGSHIRRRREELGMSQEELAHATGRKSRSAISKIELGENDVSQSALMEIAKALDTTPGELLDGPAEETIIAKNVYKIEKRSFPLLGTIAAGEPIFAEQNIEGYIQAGKDINADFCLRVQGDSMTGAHINDGDIVFIRKQPMVRDGQIAAVLVDDEATLKRCYYDRANGIIQLVAENPAYPPMVYTGNKLEDIRILGLAVAHLSMLI